MNVYVLKKHINLFLEKLKEIPKIDDYVLDRERLGKVKVKLQTTEENNKVVMELMSILPEDSMIVDQTEYPGKEYLLCIGEIDFSDFSQLKKYSSMLSILTKKSNTIRFNAWIHFSELHALFANPFIQNLTSINGKIEETTYFVFETDKKYINDVHKAISHFSNDFIIKENKIFVKLMIQYFPELYEELDNKFTKIEVNDYEEF